MPRGASDREHLGSLGKVGGRGSFRLTEERMAQIVAMIEAGNYVETACQASGVSSASYRNWRKRGIEVAEQLVASGWGLEDIDDEEVMEEAGPPSGMHANDWQCFRFLRRIEKATALGEATAVLQVRKAMGDNWAAAMTFLERKHPDRWKRRDLREIAAVERASREDDVALLEDPAAQEHLHRALEAAAMAEVVDSTAVELPADEGMSAS